MKDIDEIWMPVDDGKHYICNNFGVIKSLNYNKTGKEENLTPTLHGEYMEVCLRKRPFKKKTFLVHDVIYEAFCGQIPPGMQVNHINEDKTDNRLCNLNLLTPKENSNWGSRNKRISEAKINKVLVKPVLQINKDTGEIINEFPSSRQARREFGDNVSNCLIGKCKTAYGYIWKYKAAQD